MVCQNYVGAKKNIRKSGIFFFEFAQKLVSDSKRPKIKLDLPYSANILPGLTWSMFPGVARSCSLLLHLRACCGDSNRFSPFAHDLKHFLLIFCGVAFLRAVCAQGMWQVLHCFPCLFHLLRVYYEINVFPEHS